MANDGQLDILRQGPEVWNRWLGKDGRSLRPDLNNADLREADLSDANLAYVELNGADLTDAILRGADLSYAYLAGAHIQGANLNVARLRNTDLRGADLQHASLVGTYLQNADLRHANLTGADLRSADLSNANLRGANLLLMGMEETLLSNADLSGAEGLDRCFHTGPSSIDFRTLAKSGPLPNSFLRGCGLPDTLIKYLPSMLNQPIQFYSCFISYSTKDQEFADRLHADLQNKGVRCWFAPHDMKGGEKLHEQIDEAIRIYQRLLLILSPASMDSRWVKTEIANARARESQEQRRMLFPVRLVDFEVLRDWRCFDSDAGTDSAREIREFYVPDFSNWKDHDAYQKEFEKLLRDLRTDTKAVATP